MTKCVLITGASGEIGSALVDKLRDEESLTLLVTSTTRSEGWISPSARLVPLTFDAQCANAVPNLMMQCKSHKITHFIQLHGNASKADSLDDQSLEKLKYNLNVNSLSTILIISSLLESMIAQKFGRIVLMDTASSSHGGGKNSFGYGLAKHSVQYVLKHIAKHYTDKNILANSVAPGAINTKFHSKTMGRSEAEIRARFDSVKLGRPGNAGEVASLIHFLAFENEFVTGQSIKIDGGDFV